MSIMENMQPDLEEQARQDAVYEAAMSSISGKQRVQERDGYVVMSAAMGWGEGSLGDGLFGKASRAAKLFMVFFACAAPVALMYAVML